MSNPNSEQCDQILVSGGWCQAQAETYDEQRGESYCEGHAEAWDKYRREQIKALVQAHGELCECGHLESDHRSIPPYHCQHGMGTGPADCECPRFTEEDKERLDAEYDAQRYEDWQERYR